MTIFPRARRAVRYRSRGPTVHAVRASNESCDGHEPCAAHISIALAWGVDALTCRWYQNLAARASYAPAPMKGEKAAQVLASMPPRWLPATRPAPPCYFLLHQPFPTSRLTHHSYGVLAGALALAGEPLSPKVGSILAGKRAGRARSGQDRREQPISAAPAHRDVQRGRLNAVLVVYGVRCIDASCCVVCCLSACSEP